MYTLYLDAFSGISGDMFIGALLDLGLDFDVLQTELKKLNLSGYKLYYEKKAKNSVCGSDFDVILEDGKKDCGIEECHPHHNGRSFSDIKQIIENSNLSAFVKTHSIDVFHEIAEAESIVHNKNIDEIHFHEVGAIDSIIDIVGSFIGLEKLNITEIISSPLTDGCGHINIAHGEMPVPVPAVMQMRVNSSIPIHQRLDIHTELITPTGLGIIKNIVSNFSSIPDDMNILKIGYGFGKRDTGCFNALRMLLLKKKLNKNKVNEDEIMELEANIDDQSSEQISYAMNLLINMGAKDVFLTPIMMKKSRMASKLTVLIDPTQKDKFIEAIFSHTATLGIRYSIKQRTIMSRKMLKIKTIYGTVRVKAASYKDINHYDIEYEDCAKLAQSLNIPIENIYFETEKICKEQLKEA